MKEQLDFYYQNPDLNAKKFDDLPVIQQMDLQNWYTKGKMLNESDKKFLLKLYQADNFQAWDCQRCGGRIYSINTTYVLDVCLRCSWGGGKSKRNAMGYKIVNPELRIKPLSPVMLNVRRKN